MRCPSCNEEITKSARFCPECGTSLEGAVLTKREPKVPDGNGHRAGVDPPVLQPARPAGVAWGAGLSAAWHRKGTRYLAAAGAATFVGILLTFVGSVVASSGSVTTTSAAHGTIWAALGVVLAVLALASLRLARAETGVWSPRRDLVVGAVLASVAGLLGLVDVIVVHAASAARGGAAGPAWGFAGYAWAFTAVAWLAYTRPIQRGRALVLAGISAALSLLLAVVGLAIGLGDTAKDISRGGAWFSWALIFAFLAVAAVFGRRAES
jgi:hypothetical protein